MKKEMVNHPEHYKQDGREECIVEMENIFGVRNLAMWCWMTAYKYLYRKGRKDGNSMEQDLKKASWYVEYVDKLKEKWHTDTFDVRMEQQMKKMIKDAKRNVRQAKKKEAELNGK